MHCWDGYENHDEPWIPRENMPDLSASLVFSAQQAAGTAIPIYRACSAGVVFTPGHTRLRCGNGGDSGGHCHVPNAYNKFEHWCVPVVRTRRRSLRPQIRLQAAPARSADSGPGQPQASATLGPSAALRPRGWSAKRLALLSTLHRCELEPRPTRFDAPGDGCVGNSWRPRDIGAFLLRVSEYQARCAPHGAPAAHTYHTRPRHLARPQRESEPNCVPIVVVGGQARSGRSSYNELIVDGDRWARKMPQTVEFIFQVKGKSTHGSLADAAKHHAAFLRRYGIHPNDSPLLEIDPDDWAAPFRVAEGFSAESVTALAGPGRFPAAHDGTASPSASSASLVGWGG